MDDYDCREDRIYTCRGCKQSGIPESAASYSKDKPEQLVHVEDMGSMFGTRYVPYPIECGPLVEDGGDEDIARWADAGVPGDPDANGEVGEAIDFDVYNGIRKAGL